MDHRLSRVDQRSSQGHRGRPGSGRKLDNRRNRGFEEDSPPPRPDSRLSMNNRSLEDEDEDGDFDPYIPPRPESRLSQAGMDDDDDDFVPPAPPQYLQIENSRVDCAAFMANRARSMLDGNGDELDIPDGTIEAPAPPSEPRPPSDPRPKSRIRRPGSSRSSSRSSQATITSASPDSWSENERRSESTLSGRSSRSSGPGSGHDTVDVVAPPPPRPGGSRPKSGAGRRPPRPPSAHKGGSVTAKPPVAPPPAPAEEYRGNEAEVEASMPSSLELVEEESQSRYPVTYDDIASPKLDKRLTDALVLDEMVGTLTEGQAINTVQKKEGFFYF